MFIVNLKQKNSQLFFTSKMGLFRSSLRTAIQDIQLWGTICKSSKAKERKLTEEKEKLGGDVKNKLIGGNNKLIGGNKFEGGWLFIG